LTPTIVKFGQKVAL